jgi:hypothetical protein
LQKLLWQYHLSGWRHPVGYAESGFCGEATAVGGQTPILVCCRFLRVVKLTLLGSIISNLLLVSEVAFAGS